MKIILTLALDVPEDAEADLDAEAVGDTIATILTALSGESVTVRSAEVES